MKAILLRCSGHVSYETKSEFCKILPWEKAGSTRTWFSLCHVWHAQFMWDIFHIIILQWSLSNLVKICTPVTTGMHTCNSTLIGTSPMLGVSIQQEMWKLLGCPAGICTIVIHAIKSCCFNIKSLLFCYSRHVTLSHISWLLEDLWVLLALNWLTLLPPRLEFLTAVPHELLCSSSCYIFQE